MENKIKEGTHIKLRDDLKVGEIYGGIYFTEHMSQAYQGRVITITKILPNKIFTIEDKGIFLSYDMIDSIISFYNVEPGDRVMDVFGRIGTLLEDNSSEYKINYDKGKYDGSNNSVESFGLEIKKIKSEEKVHKEHSQSPMMEFIKETKETKDKVEKLEEIAELYKEQIEVVSIIQKKLEEIIKKHDGFNIDVDVTIDNKINKKLKETINKLSGLDS